MQPSPRKMVGSSGIGIWKSLHATNLEYRPDAQVCMSHYVICLAQGNKDGTNHSLPVCLQLTCSGTPLGAVGFPVSSNVLITTTGRSRTNHMGILPTTSNPMKPLIYLPSQSSSSPTSLISVTLITPLHNPDMWFPFLRLDALHCTFTA